MLIELPSPELSASGLLLLKCCTPGKNTPSRKVRKKMIICESEFIQVAARLLLHRLLTGKK
jgi:hypothetical protein